MQVAVVGCAHGELEKIYNTIELIEQEEKIKVDLLLCCGDFQATRNLDDLECTAQPAKYRHIGTFYKYYSGEKEAPILTIFIGGNHEASNFLQELPYGGWVAPNIYYLGYAGVINYKGLRIGGLSGIFNKKDYFRGHYESPPYNPNTLRSVYHYRQQEIFRLQQLHKQIDVIMSHDWPSEVYYFGNATELIESKPRFGDQIRDNVLGSPPLYKLLKHLKPKYWFSAHLHCKFAAVIPHEDEEKTETKFLGLDQCVAGLQFLQILDIDVSNRENDSNELQYDLEWLTILNTTKHLTQVGKSVSHMPKEGDPLSQWDFQPLDEEKDAVRQKFGDNFEIPRTFEKTAAPYDPLHRYSILRRSKSVQFRNRQTINFCKLLGIDDPLDLVAAISDGHVVSENGNSNV